MFNNNALNVIIVFSPGTRGNFLRNCLTLSPNTADSLFKKNEYQWRLQKYKECANEVSCMIDNPPWGPGHIDSYYNFSQKRIENAVSADRYVHCGHLHQIPQENGNENVAFANKKFVFITMSIETSHEFKTSYPSDVELVNEIDIYCNYGYITQFVNNAEWYNFPYLDVFNKDKFLMHCQNIDNNCYTDDISDYYDTYYKSCIFNNKRISTE